MRVLALSFALVLCLLMAACKQEKKSVAQWPYGVKYEVFVLAYADGNGDGKGDFKGLTAKLDYLKDLGVNGIWLMPIMNSPSYHKYDVTDYKSINPEYGTIDDFKTFVAEAHARHINVIVDLILNHTGYDHPWFQAAMKDKKSQYRDYYVWAKKDSIRAQMAKKTTFLDSDNITQWHAVNGDTLGEHYYGYFYGGMPDLNFDNPKVKQEFVDIGKFWLTEMNVDGFRLDAARHIFPTDRANDNHAFWLEFRQEMEKIKPGVYLVGEVWAPAKEVAPYLMGLPALFNFDMGYAITGVVNAGQDTVGLIKKYKEISDYYASVTNEYIDATFLKNHDQNRILTELNSNPDKMRVAAAILLTLPGTPYLYYGEEIGMLGAKPDEFIREPFRWSKDTAVAEQTRWEQPRYSTAQSVTPLDAQQADPNSLYNFYKALIHVRNSSEALTRGILQEANINNASVISFKRTYNDEHRLVLHNISGTTVTVPLKGGNIGFGRIDYSTNKEASLAGEQVTLPAYSTVILK